MSQCGEPPSLAIAVAIAVEIAAAIAAAMAAMAAMAAAIERVTAVAIAVAMAAAMAAAMAVAATVAEEMSEKAVERVVVMAVELMAAAELMERERAVNLILASLETTLEMRWEKSKDWRPRCKILSGKKDLTVNYHEVGKSSIKVEYICEVDIRLHIS